MKLSNLVLSTPPSGIREIFNRIAETQDVISFALGEPDSTTSPQFMEAAKQSMDLGQTHYTPNAGIWALRTAIAQSYSEKNISPGQVVVTAGATEALLMVFMTLLNASDEVIVMEPYWPTYLGQIKAVGAVPRFVRTYEEDGFLPCIEQLEAAVNKNTRMIIVNSPSNPTGAMMDVQTLDMIAAFALKYDLIVLSDEVYRHIVFDKQRFASISDSPGMDGRWLIVDSFSKSYAMTGWRVGYIIAPAPIAKALESMHEYGVSCIAEPVQRIAIAALAHGSGFLHNMRQSLEARRNLIVDGISSIKGLRCQQPPATFYLYFNVKATGMCGKDFVYRLLEQEKIALAPGSAFGAGQDDYVRLSYANSEENLNLAIGKIDRFVRQTI